MDEPKMNTTGPLRWIDVSVLPLEGRGWSDTKSVFDRLPARAEGCVREPVWRLSQDSAGLLLSFRSDTPELRAKWTLRKEQLAMLHMPASGVSGIDLYVRKGEQWCWMSAARPMAAAESTAILFENLAPVERDFLLYLPLYNGIESFHIAVADGRLLDPVSAQGRPIVFYGTSIVQGGCVSRPGLAYPAILGRRLGKGVVNLGFSGNGKAEPEIASLLGEIDCAMYVVDCLPNLGPEGAPKVEPFLRALRKRRMDTPILIVEHLIFPDGEFVPERHRWYRESNWILQTIFERLSPKDRNLYYLPAANMIGADGEGTVDGTHPSDLGMIRIADAMEDTLRRILAKEPR